MKVNVINQQKDLKILKTQVKRIVRSVLSLEEEECDEVNIYFVTIQTISELHGQFFNDPSPTDCITFPLDDSFPSRLLGEVFICPATAIAYAEKHHKDPYEETTLYIVHGLLHLIGYDDLDEQDRKRMKKGERDHMVQLKKNRLLLPPRIC